MPRNDVKQHPAFRRLTGWMAQMPAGTVVRASELAEALGMPAVAALSLLALARQARVIEIRFRLPGEETASSDALGWYRSMGDLIESVPEAERATAGLDDPSCIEVGFVLPAPPTRHLRLV